MSGPVAVPGNESFVSLQRPARALIGWLPEEQAVHILAGQRRDIAVTDEIRERVRGAQRAVARRSPQVTRPEAIREVPASALSAHGAALQASDAAQGYFKEGWRVALADLRLVCALQPHVYTDHAEERMSGLDPSDIGSVATVSLPLATTTAIPAQYDPTRQAWIISSPNPNVRIVGNWGGQVQPGVTGFGFVVRFLQSFVQVARVQGRFILRDGYHRALGFLQRGLAIVPVFAKDFGEFDDLRVGPGVLPASAYLGPTPPFLPDYFDDAVSAGVTLPAFQKMIVVHGLELTPFG